MINIYVANLGKYNEGYLVGKWIELPASEEEINEMFVEIKLGYFDEDGEYHSGFEEDGRLYEEWAIHDSETDVDGLEIGEYSSISKLNELAEELENVNIEQLNKIHECIGGDIEECIEVLRSGDYCVLSDVADNDDLGRQYIDEIYGGISELSRETLEQYFDYESYARDELNDFTICDDGTAIQVYR